jgi:phosphoribosyl 1,2-cyclic phosphodiesterase
VRFISLQSGSNGNSLFVEAGGVRLLFDAGISGIQAERRLASHGIDIRSVDALIISHDHTDHVSHSGIYQRKYGMPLYITRRTLAVAEQRLGLGRLHTVCHFRPGSTLDLGEVRVETIPTAHDSAEGVGFVVDDGSGRLGILTDLGHVFDGLPEVIDSLDAIFIESNYDPDMLKHGPYPAFLKKRITGEQGHISNLECAGLLGSHGRGLRWACLGHLSEQNNEPGLAMKTLRKAIGTRFPIHIAGRYEVTEAFSL